MKNKRSYLSSSDSAKHLAIAQTAVGVVASFCCPPLSAAMMGGTIGMMLLAKKRERDEIIENCSNPIVMNAMMEMTFGKRNKD